jgi:hypothetical protein
LAAAQMPLVVSAVGEVKYSAPAVTMSLPRKSKPIVHMPDGGTLIGMRLILQPLKTSDSERSACQCSIA